MFFILSIVFALASFVVFVFAGYCLAKDNITWFGLSLLIAFILDALSHAIV